MSSMKRIYDFTVKKNSYNFKVILKKKKLQYKIAMDITPLIDVTYPRHKRARVSTIFLE